MQPNDEIERLRADCAKLETAHGQNVREIDRLRAERAAANARIMEIERVVEVLRGAEIRANNFRREADMMHDEYKTLRAERDALRALLRECRSGWYLNEDLNARIAVALKG